jgi:starvation-inducible DNA-binding protein
MSASQPAGTISQRANGAVWQKPTGNAREWKQLKPPVKGSGASVHQETPPTGAPGESATLPWATMQEKYALDAHLPPEEVHPQFVDIDAEGDIDTKPVLMWKDQYGADRRTYTQRFHWNRFGQLHEKLKELGESWLGAHEALASKAKEGDENAMVALLQLKTGHSASDLLSLQPQHTHVARDMPAAPSGMQKGGKPPVKALKQVLQATLRLRDGTQLCHWNVEGPLFASLHVLFEQQYNELSDAADDIAERLRALNVKVPAPVAQDTELAEDAEGMLRGLCELHEALEELCGDAVAQAEKAGDAGTVDLLGKRAASHGKAAWMLRASGGLEPSPKVAKGGATTDRAHPDRAHFLLKHARGHAYASSVSDPDIANHVHKRLVEGGDKVFNATESGVTAALSAAGVNASDPSVMRHHAVTMMAADYLSKTPKVDLNTHGLEAAHANLQACSEHIATHFGHDPLKPGMSYVPPAVAVSYLEESGADRMFPKTYAKLKGEPTPRERAERTVAKAFGSIEGREAEVEKVYAGILNKLKKAKRNDSCSTTEDEPSLIYPEGTNSLSPDPQSSTPTTPAPTSTTPGRSSPSSVASKAPPLVLCEALEKGEAAYLARLAPPSGDRRARYIQEPEVLLSLLGNELSENLMVPGTKFKCGYPGEDGALVDGYLCIDERIGRLCTFSHDGTGVRAQLGVDSIRQILLEYHRAHEKAKQFGAKEFPEIEVGPVKKSLFGLGEAEEPGSDMETMSDIGMRKPEHQIVFEEASRAYMTALKRNLLGDMSDDQLRQINLALITNNYKQVVALCKAESSPSVGPSPAQSGGVGSTGDTTKQRPGPKALPIGAQTERKDGTYHKDGDHKWSKNAKRGEKSKQAKDDTSEGKESATLVALRDRLKKLRQAFRGAAKNEQSKIISEITRVKEKIKKLKANSEGSPESEETKKSSVALTISTNESLHLANDPIEMWLRKAEAQGYQYLDPFIQNCSGDFLQFVEDLAYAPPGVHADAHHLRMTKGASALRSRFTIITGR